MPSQELPRRDLAFRDELAGFSLTLKRNCSISPSGLLCAFGGLSVAALGIGIGFAIAGAWLILPFAGVEVLGMCVAFVLYARRAADYEKIELAEGRLTVEVTEAERRRRYELDSRSAQVLLQKDEGYGARVWVKGGLHGVPTGELRREQLEVGRHLDAGSRAELAAELSRRLRIRIGERRI